MQREIGAKRFMKECIQLVSCKFGSSFEMFASKSIFHDLYFLKSIIGNKKIYKKLNFSFDYCYFTCIECDAVFAGGVGRGLRLMADS